MEIVRVRNGMFSTNTYLIGDNQEGCYIIDPSDDYTRIKRVIDEKFNGLVKAVLLTHGHLDHVGSVDRLANDYNCDVYLSDNDKMYIDGSLKKYSNNLQEFNIQLNCPTIDSYFIKDKNIVVYETPGHTPGSVCYLFKNENVIFVGDTLFKGSVGRCDLTGGSQRELVKSLKIFKNMPNDLKVCCGHEGETTIGNEKLYNPYLRNI